MSLCFIFRLGAFENGIAEGSIDLSVGEILAIRLLVNSDSPVWAILSEVLIKMSENWEMDKVYFWHVTCYRLVWRLTSQQQKPEWINNKSRPNTVYWQRVEIIVKNVLKLLNLYVTNIKSYEKPNYVRNFHKMLLIKLFCIKIPSQLDNIIYYCKRLTLQAISGTEQDSIFLVH